MAATGYANAGQVCISTQRVLAAGRIYDDLLDALRPKVEALTTGNQLDEQVKMGPMIRERDAVRVEEWIERGRGQRRPRGHRRPAAGRDLRADARGRRQAGDARSSARSCSAPPWR